MAVSRTRGREVDAPPPKSDAYTGLLAISLGAMIVGCVLLYLDYSSYPPGKPPQAPAPTAVRPAGGQPGPGTSTTPVESTDKPADGAPANTPMN